ncbi:MAG: hypothetical protein ACRD2G_01700 [Terriglobia bacterium]
MLIALALVFAAGPAGALPRKHPPLTTVTVLVTDAATHKPIFQAQLTLEFRDTRSRMGKTISLSSKTDVRGEYKFSFIPMETVLLVVTAPNHQTFGKRFEITQPNQTIHAALKAPQPLR